MYVGTPAQQMDVVFDSGSGMLILATDECTGCSPVKNANGAYDEYYPSKSTTASSGAPSNCTSNAQTQENAWCPQIVYGSATVDTKRYSDTVCFNGKLGSTGN